MKSTYRSSILSWMFAAAAALTSACNPQPPAGAAPETSAAAAPAAGTSPAVDPATAIDPAARALVEGMGEYLKGLDAFAIQADTTTDEVLLAGPKVQYGGTVALTYQAPDKLRMRVVKDEEDTQEFFYDGQALSVWIEGKKNWASAPMSGRAADVVAATEEKYDVSFPMGDLISRAARKELLGPVEAGVVLGTGRVDGVECDHLGFHQPGVDWQVWIERGDRPLPRKLVITTLDEPSQPQHVVTMTWDLAPPIQPGMFTFTPPAGAERIVIAERAGTPNPGASPAKENR